MINLFGKLPEEIIREHILPYSYCKQSDSLCKDIQEFYKTKKKVNELYKTIYTEAESMNWLDNDITRFMNNDIPTMNGYTYRHLDIWSRLYYFSNADNEYIEMTINKIDCKGNVNTNVNIKLGLMNNEERKMLTTFLHKIQQFTFVI